MKHLDLWKHILDSISKYLPDNAYIGHLTGGVVIHFWGDDCDVCYQDICREPFIELENLKLTRRPLIVHSGYLVYPDDTGKLGSVAEVIQRVAVATMFPRPDPVRSRLQRFSSELMKNSDELLRIEKLLINSILSESFDLYYQSQHDLVTNEICGVEVLSRFTDDGLLRSKTHDYIVALEDSPYITDFTEISFSKLVVFYNKNASLFPPDFRLSYNLSPAVFQWKSFDFLGMVKKHLAGTPQLSSHLTIEITESAYYDKLLADKIIETLDELKKLGIKISIDDFGSGYGSMKLLSHGVPSSIKLDRDTTLAYFYENQPESYISNLIRAARQSSLQIVCEGIETGEQRNFLADRKIAYGQGYFFSRPVPENEFIQYYKKTLST